MLVRRAEMLPIECIVRGYVSGSAWKEYRRSGTIHGRPMPPGLQQSDRLPEPVFTPSTKAEVGLHDENISFEQAVAIVGQATADEAAAISLAAYGRAVAHAAEQGIVIADTKFELGWIDGKLSICDEVLTPDSSRFWEAADWRPGTTPALVRQAAGAGLPGDHSAGTRPRRRRPSPTRWCGPPPHGTSPPTSACRGCHWPTGPACKGDRPMSTYRRPGRGHPAPRRGRPAGRHHRTVAARPRLRRGGGRAGGQGHPLQVEADDEPTARSRVEELCHRFLTNPVIEDATITIGGAR